MMKSAAVASVFLALVSTSAFADSETLSPRLTADVAPRGGWSVGIFNPLRIAVTDSIELEAHPLLIAVSPHLGVRQKLWSHPSGWRVTGAYGISVPTPALRLTPPFGLGSYFTPSCLVTAHDSAQAATCKKPGGLGLTILAATRSS